MPKFRCMIRVGIVTKRCKRIAELTFKPVTAKPLSLSSIIKSDNSLALLTWLVINAIMM